MTPTVTRTDFTVETSSLVTIYTVSVHKKQTNWQTDGQQGSQLCSCFQIRSGLRSLLWIFSFIVLIESVAHPWNIIVTIKAATLQRFTATLQFYKEWVFDTETDAGWSITSLNQSIKFTRSHIKFSHSEMCNFGLAHAGRGHSWSSTSPYCSTFLRKL